MGSLAFICSTLFNLPASKWMLVCLELRYERCKFGYWFMKVPRFLCTESGRFHVCCLVI